MSPTERPRSPRPRASYTRSSDIRAWDLSEPGKGRALFEILRDHTEGNPHISSIWVADPQGRNVLDSWTFPPRKISAVGRPYFDKHLQGESGPIILGDERPGSVTGTARFTYSTDIRNPDGSLHAIVVVGVASGYLDRLYAEAATWRGARAGLYTVNGDVLARLATLPKAAPAFSAQVRELMVSQGRGSASLADEDQQRIVGWARSERLPSVYATASRPLDSALAQWRTHAATLLILTLLGVVAIIIMVRMALVARNANQRAAARELTIREIDHRVKSSLQLAASLISLKSRKAPAEARDQLMEVRKQLMSIADVHALLQEGAGQNEVDLGPLLAKIVSGSNHAPERVVTLIPGPPLSLAAEDANSVSVILNELITNGMKYGRSEVIVSWTVDGPRAAIVVRDDGPGFPVGFDATATGRFGLNAMQQMASRFQGMLSFANTATGASVILSFPLTRLRVVHVA